MDCNSYLDDDCEHRAIAFLVRKQKNFNVSFQNIQSTTTISLIEGFRG